MSNFWANIKRRLSRPGRPDSMSGLAQLMPRMIQKIAGTQEVEYSCDDVLRLLDQFAEASLRGEDVRQLMPLVVQHLEMCADCREEYEALLKVLKATSA